MSQEFYNALEPFDPAQPGAMTVQELGGTFSPHRYPKTVADDAYGGELVRHLNDADYFVDATTYRNSPYNAAAADAESAISFASAIAMNKTLDCTPERLHNDMEPAVRSAVRISREALSLFHVAGLTTVKTALHLRIVHRMIEPLILYKPMCMFDDNPYALRQRQRMKKSTFFRLTECIEKIYSNPPQGEQGDWIGTLHEASTLAVLNSWMNPDVMALPTLEADDMGRSTDLVHITRGDYEQSSLRYIQVSSSSQKKNAKSPPHQTYITDRDLKNRGNDGRSEWLTTKRLFTFNKAPANFTPKNRQSCGMVKRLSQSLHDKVQNESTAFPLMP